MDEAHFSADEATKDTLSRACIRLGTDLRRDATMARDRIAAIQQRVDAVSPGDTAQIIALAEELAAYLRETDQGDVFFPPTTASHE